LDCGLAQAAYTSFTDAEQFRRKLPFSSPFLFFCTTVRESNNGDKHDYVFYLKVQLTLSPFFFSFHRTCGREECRRSGLMSAFFPPLSFFFVGDPFFFFPPPPLLLLVPRPQPRLEGITPHGRLLETFFSFPPFFFLARILGGHVPFPPSFLFFSEFARRRDGGK